MNKKLCPKCNSQKPLSEFCKDKSTRDGYQSYCRECTRRNNRQSYAKKHPDYQRRRKGRNPENQCYSPEYHRQWREGKRGIELKYEQRWRENNPEANRLRRHRRRAKINNLKGFATPEQIRQRIEYYGRRCAYCGGAFEHLDHVIPTSKGGSNWPANLRPCCSKCNGLKGNLYWKDWLQSVSSRLKASQVV